MKPKNQLSVVCGFCLNESHNLPNIKFFVEKQNVICAACIAHAVNIMAGTAEKLHSSHTIEGDK
jgi:hypothetical protein